MAQYDVSIRTTLTTATVAATLAALRGSTLQRATIREIHVFTTSAVAGGIGLARSTALTATPSASVAPVPHDPAEIAAGSVAYTAAATMATNGGISAVFRRWTHSGSQGAGILWSYSLDGPLVLSLGNVAAAGELCFVNLNAATPATYDINITLAE